MDKVVALAKNRCFAWCIKSDDVGENLALAKIQFE
jgi:hypothetical protein